MTIWRRVACWISNATRAQAHARACAPTLKSPPHAAPPHTHTHTCNTYFFSSATMVSLTRLIVTLRLFYLSC